MADKEYNEFAKLMREKWLLVLKRVIDNKAVEEAEMIVEAEYQRLKAGI